MSSTKSRLAIELLVDAYMQAEIQRDLIVLKSSFKSMFDVFYHSEADTESLDIKHTSHVEQAHMHQLTDRIEPLLN